MGVADPIEGLLPRGKLPVILSFLLFAVFIWMAFDGTAVGWMRDAVQQAGGWAPVAYVGLRASTYIIAPLSIPGIEITAGLLFGIWQGTALSVLGQTLGGSTNFWVSRLLGRPMVERLAGRKATERIDAVYQRVQGWKGLLFARMVLPGYDFLSYAAGLTPLRFREYVIVTAAGGAPATLVYVALGSTLADSPGLFLLASLGLGCLAALAILIYRRINGGQLLSGRYTGGSGAGSA